MSKKKKSQGTLVELTLSSLKADYPWQILPAKRVFEFTAYFVNSSHLFTLNLACSLYSSSKVI